MKLIKREGYFGQRMVTMLRYFVMPSEIRAVGLGKKRDLEMNGEDVEKIPLEG